MSRRLAMRIFLLTLLLLPTLALAQPATELQWVSLDGSPPGTPVEVLVDLQQSSLSATVLDIIVHGLWVGPAQGADGKTYDIVRLPGARSIGQPGAPMLPAVQMDLLLPLQEGAPATVLGAEILSSTRLENIVPWPQGIPERDHPEGDPYTFLLDEQLYAGQEPFPSTFLPAVQEEIGPGPLGAPGASFEAWPCKWSPPDQTLEVATRMKAYIDHGAPPLSPGDITIEKSLMLAELVHNWEVVQEYLRINPHAYEGAYLFVFAEEYRDALQPLMDQKEARGFKISTLVLDNLVATDCATIRTGIDSWLDRHGWWEDRYALLVGDTNLIPLCNSPTTDTGLVVPTDDLYASPGGDDLDEEILLGRLSVDTPQDLANQVGKILAYMDQPQLLWDNNIALLVAHDELAPNKYEGAHESVRTASYAEPPNFVTRYGSAGWGDADIINDIDGGVGLVAYRGHGDEDAWTDWNPAADYFDRSDVNMLSNGNRTPVVWSFACTNADLDIDDCIAEVAMELSPGGAVSYYGATIPSYTVQNHELDRAMFQKTYDELLGSQGAVMMMGERQMETNEGSDNSWMYLLLGDPEMRIRRESPPEWTLILPEQLPPCTGCQLELQVLDGEGLPVFQAIASAWKPAGAQGGALARSAAAAPDVQANRYTDAQGQAAIPVSPDSDGEILVTVRDFQGQLVQGVVPVASGTSAPGPGLAGLSLQARPNVLSGLTTFHFGRALPTDATLVVHDLRGREIVRQAVPAGSTDLRWEARDAAGRPVAAGSYMVSLRGAGQQLVTRVVVLD